MAEDPIPSLEYLKVQKKNYTKEDFSQLMIKGHIL